DITSALANFPVLIYLSSSSGINSEDVTFVFDEVGANSLKIAVTDADGTTERYVEIDEWDSGSEKAWIFVKVNSIASGSDTVLYLYFDNTHADNTTYVGVKESAAGEAVWDANFVMVQHMGEGSGTVKDSTNHDNDGSQGQTPVYGQTGKIADAVELDGVHTTGDYFNLGDVAEFTFAAFTWSGWVLTHDKTADNTNSMMVADKSGGGGNREWQFSLERANDTLPWKVKPNLGNSSGNWGMTSLQSIATLAFGVWRYITVTWDGTTVKIYIQGAYDSQTGYTGTIKNTTQPVSIGKTASTSQFYDGLTDELRFSDTDRNAAWIAASFESGSDDLLDWGTEETAVSASLLGEFIVRQAGSAEL
ncbi:hypothetical protein LCGC14_3021200, partial [marine sediment metagenome]